MILGSCSVSKDLYTTWNKEVIEDGKKLPQSSLYVSKDSITQYSIWENVMDLKNFDNTIFTDSLSNTKVKLIIENENRIQLLHIYNDQIIDSIKIDGRFEKEYFVSNQNHKKILIPLIYYQNLNKQLIFFNDADENLVIHGLMWNEGAILFISGTGGGNSTYKYKNTRHNIKRATQNAEH